MPQNRALCGNGLTITFDKTFPKPQISDSSNLKKFAGNNFKFDRNGRKFSKKLENSVGKGEIACYKQFLISQQSFQKTCTADT